MSQPIDINSPSRQTIPSRPCFECGTAIPWPQIWPIGLCHYKIRMMLPIQGEDGYSYFETEFSDIQDFLQSFRLDPEGTIESVWHSPDKHPAGFLPDVRRRKRSQYIQHRAPATVLDLSALE